MEKEKSRTLPGKAVVLFLTLFLFMALVCTAHADVYGEDIIAYAKTWVGSVPYVVGGGTTHADVTASGTDCSGFICGVYYHFGIDLWNNRGAIRNSPYVYDIGTTDYNQAQPGDILYWEKRSENSFGHVTMYAGNGMMVEETSDGTGNVQYTQVTRLTASGVNWPIKGIYRAYGVTLKPAVSYYDFGEKLNARMYFPRSKNNVLYLYMESQYPNEGRMYGLPFTSDQFRIGYDWELKRQSDGTYVCCSYYDSNRVLEVKNAGTASGTVVQTGTYTGGNHQKWYIVAGDSGFMLVPKHAPEMALTIKNSDFAIPSDICLAPAQKLATQCVYFPDVTYDRIHGFCRSGSVSRPVVLEVGQNLVIPTTITSINNWNKIPLSERTALRKVTPYSRDTSIVQGYTDGAIRGMAPGTVTVDYTSYYDPRLTFTVDVTVVAQTNEKKSYLPASITEIEQDAFAYTAFDTLVIPDGCTTIGPYAFMGSSLRHLYIPASVTGINSSAFLQHADDLAIYASAGSAAIDFAKEREILYVYVTGN